MKNVVNLSNSFLTDAKNYFDSDITIINASDPEKSANDVNKWVDSETNHKISNIVKKGIQIFIIIVFYLSCLCMWSFSNFI